jgi:hypothetical protein
MHCMYIYIISFHIFHCYQKCFPHARANNIYIFLQRDQYIRFTKISTSFTAEVHRTSLRVERTIIFHKMNLFGNYVHTEHIVSYCYCYLYLCWNDSLVTMTWYAVCLQLPHMEEC